MIVAGGHIRNFGYYLARSNTIMYNINGLMDSCRRTEGIAYSKTISKHEANK